MGHIAGAGKCLWIADPAIRTALELGGSEVRLALDTLASEFATFFPAAHAFIVEVASTALILVADGSPAILAVSVSIAFDALARVRITGLAAVGAFRVAFAASTEIVFANRTRTISALDGSVALDTAHLVRATDLMILDAEVGLPFHTSNACTSGAAYGRAGKTLTICSGFAH